MKIITLKEARILGLKRYYTGIICKHGHDSERFVNSRGCVECQYKSYSGNHLFSRRIRQEAIKNDQQYYFTVIPCKRGHIAFRLVSNYACEECMQITQPLWKENNKDKVNQTNKKSYIKNREFRIQLCKEYRLAHTDYFKEYERLRLINNRAYIYAKNAKRRATKLDATPDWYEKEQIEQLYEGAQYLKRLTGIRWDVDHIVPLNGRPYIWENGEVAPEVCGLHVYANLQYLTQQDNYVKSNKLGAV